MLLLPMVPSQSAPADDPDVVQQMVDRAVSAVRPSLVRIRVVSTEYSEGREVKEISFGSGAIISQDGYVVTNHHVAGHARQMTCTLSDRTEVDAKLIGTDALTDIAVIQLTPQDGSKFPVARFGDSSKLKVGDRVLAMGSPLSLSQSVTMGIVSNTEMIAPPMMSGSLSLDGQDVGSVVRWIGHDALIHPGNSGGPLVNMQGEIIGVNEISMGLGGAIPGNLAREIADKLIARGKVTRAWFGFTTQPLLRSFSEKRGVLISGVMVDSPAEKAGLQPGDIMIRLAGRDVTVQFAEDRPLFNQFWLSLDVGKEVDAVVLRDGKETLLKITPVERPVVESRGREFKEWGLTARKVSRIVDEEEAGEETDPKVGVVVTTVRQGGPAESAKPKVMPGDVILEVAGKPITLLEDLSSITSGVVSGSESPVPALVKFKRGDREFVTVVKLGIREIQDPGLEVAKAWLPVNTQVLTAELAEALGIKGKSGVRLTLVYPGTEAEKAGLKVGDVITSLDGAALPNLQSEDTEVFPAMIRQYKIGSKVELAVLREGKEVKIAVTLPASPKLSREMLRYEDKTYEFTVRDISFLDRANAKWPESDTGVLVESTGMGGWAALGGLRVGDLIVSVDGRPVKDVEAFRGIMEDLGKSKAKITVLKVRRGSLTAFVEMNS